MDTERNEQNAKAESKMFEQPTPDAAPAPDMPEGEVRDQAERNTTTDGEYENVDHIGRMRELIAMLPDASPSGATTIAQKLTEHLDAHLDPEAYNERQRQIRERHEEDERVRDERRQVLKKRPNEQPAA
jgi:hypothetical protein